MVVVLEDTRCGRRDRSVTGWWTPHRQDERTSSKEVIVMTKVDELLELIEGALSDNDRWRLSHAWYPTVAAASPKFGAPSCPNRRPTR